MDGRCCLRKEQSGRVLLLSVLALSVLPFRAWSQAAANPPRVPPLQIIEEQRRYTLQAGTIEALREEVRGGAMQMAAHESNGLTASGIEVEYALDGAERPCRLLSAEVNLHVVTSLPEWKPDRPVAAHWRQRWDRSVAALRDHEARHAADAHAAAEALRAGLLAVVPKAHCRDVEWQVRTLISRSLLKLELRSQRFDQSTDYGRRDSVEL